MPDRPAVEARILVVDDEPKVVRLLSEILTATGFSVLAAATGDKAIELTALEQPDLILLDIMLAGPLDGYQVARRVRGFSPVPILMLTAKARESDLVQGFEAGADDYLTKPFSAKELLVRIRALLRRARLRQAPAGQPVITCGPLRVDLVRRRVSLEEREVYLSNIEYNLLVELATHPNQILLHEQLLTSVWGGEYRDDVGYLRTYIYHLRRKLATGPDAPPLIVTYPGVGYSLTCPEPPTS